MSRRGAKRI